MFDFRKIEQALYKTRKSLSEVCRELDLPIPDRTELLLDQCTHCGVWHKNYHLVPDLDENPICRYCQDLVGM